MQKPVACLFGNYFFFPLYSSETVNFARPFARRAANTRRPFFVAILSRKPCLFFLFLLEGWNVLFIVLYYYMFFVQKIVCAIQLAKLLFFFRTAKFYGLNFTYFYGLSFSPRFIGTPPRTDTAPIIHRRTYSFSFCLLSLQKP